MTYSNQTVYNYPPQPGHVEKHASLWPTASASVHFILQVRLSGSLV